MSLAHSTLPADSTLRPRVTRELCHVTSVTERGRGSDGIMGRAEDISCHVRAKTENTGGTGIKVGEEIKIFLGIDIMSSVHF